MLEYGEMEYGETKWNVEMEYGETKLEMQGNKMEYGEEANGSVWPKPFNCRSNDSANILGTKITQRYW